MSFQFDNLEEVTQANSRINYDLRFSGKTGKFTLSQAAYDNYDMNNHGFNLYRTPEGDPVLVAVPNDVATLHRGRSDADQKGKTFTADGLAGMLDLEEGKASVEFEMVEHEEEDTTYITLEELDRKEINDSSEESDEDSEMANTAITDETEEDTEEENAFV